MCLLMACENAHCAQFPYVVKGEQAMLCSLHHNESIPCVIVMSVCEHVDIPECECDIDGCDQHCNNTDGSYYCYCDVGFQLDNGDMCENGFRLAPDSHTCDGEAIHHNTIHCSSDYFSSIC